MRFFIRYFIWKFSKISKKFIWQIFVFILFKSLRLLKFVFIIYLKINFYLKIIFYTISSLGHDSTILKIAWIIVRRNKNKNSFNYFKKY